MEETSEAQLNVAGAAHIFLLEGVDTMAQAREHIALPQEAQVILYWRQIKSMVISCLQSGDKDSYGRQFRSDL